MDSVYFTDSKTMKSGIHLQKIWHSGGRIRATEVSKMVKSVWCFLIVRV